jgi:hypothetical protein
MDACVAKLIHFKMPIKIDICASTDSGETIQVLTTTDDDDRGRVDRDSAPDESDGYVIQMPQNFRWILKIMRMCANPTTSEFPAATPACFYV